jgi:Zn finger protein HypA/HybF involved in hydrogenase expression
MIDFQNFEEQKNSPYTAYCQTCGWAGPGTKAKHLANEPVCPRCRGPLVLLEPGDEVGLDI